LRRFAAGVRGRGWKITLAQESDSKDCSGIGNSLCTGSAVALRDDTDSLPYIGPHRRYPGHWFALGYSGFGFLAARLLLERWQSSVTRDHTLFEFDRTRQHLFPGIQRSVRGVIELAVLVHNESTTYRPPPSFTPTTPTLTATQPVVP
jgi:hypothetical protein